MLLLHLNNKVRCCYRTRYVHQGSRRITNIYREVSNISRTLVGDAIVDHSDVHVAGASPVGGAPTTFSSSTYSWLQGIRQMKPQDTTIIFQVLRLGMAYIRDFTVFSAMMILYLYFQGSIFRQISIFYSNYVFQCPETPPPPLRVLVIVFSLHYFTNWTCTQQTNRKSNAYLTIKQYCQKGSHNRLIQYDQSDTGVRWEYNGLTTFMNNSSLDTNRVCI